MLKNVILVVVTVLFFLSMPTVLNAGQKCPSCSMGMFWTGETKTEWGKLFQLYKCPAGHAYWFPMYKRQAPIVPTPKSIGPKCPVCGMEAFWSGQTRV